MKRTLWLCAALASSWGCEAPRDEAGDGTPAGVSWLTHVEAPLPEWLSELGLYADLETRAPAAGVVRFQPAHPLWANGADKVRLLYLPPGSAIDPTGTADGTPEGGWRFPVGTVLAKTFSFRALQRRPGLVEEAAVETRLIFRRADGWDYAVYQWNVEGTEARLLEATGWSALRLRLVDGAGDGFAYTIPGRLDCRSCHETAPGSPVLGLGRWTATPDLAGLDLFTRPPVLADLSGVARSPEEAAALSYFVGNCTFCHHGRRGSDNAAFSLLPHDAAANTVDRPTESSASGIGTRIVPGDPEGSAIFQAVVMSRQPDYDDAFKAMPPLGFDVGDPEAERVLRAWIESL